MQVICLSCGFKIDVDRAYADYEGQIKCIICGALLQIKTEDGHIKSASVEQAGRVPSERPV